MNEKKYSALVDVIKKDILGGKYRSGQPLPSVRAMMRRFAVSSLTVQRAFEELSKQGWIAGRRGSGTVVTKLGASRKIGLIVPGICYSEIFPPICKELSCLAQKEGYALLLGDLSSNDPVERSKRAKILAKQYAKEGVAGIIFQPIEFLKDSDAVNRDILAVFDAEKIPVVLLDCDIVASPSRSMYDIVGINNLDAGRRLAQHIMGQGVRNVIFLAAPNSDYSVQNRIESVRAAVVAAKGHCAELSIDVGDVTSVRKLLTRRPRPQAIICRNDHIAAHLMVTLRAMGKRVPEDILVAGFNDVEYASILSPGLTSVHLPCDEIACQAFAFLRELIANPVRSPRDCYLFAPLVVRASTTLRTKEVQ